MATPDIVVQIKGGPTKVITNPSGGATRLVELSDVDATPVANGDVLTYVSANGKFEFHPTSDSSNAFGVVNVAGQNNVIANTSSDTLELIAGTGILILTDNVNSSVTIVATGGSATDQFARDHANGAFDQANNAYANANTAIYTAAQIRANLSNTAPINYSATTGVISHADSGVIATTYGNTTYVPTVTVDARGHVMSITNTAITFPPSGVTSVAGKTGAVLLDTYDIAENTSSNLWFTAARVRANISNTAPINYAPATGVISHADSGVVATTYGNTTFVPTITVDARGHVTSITNTAIALPPSTDEYARATANGAYAHANGAFSHANGAFDKANTAIYTAAQIRANISNTAPINYDATTGVISHALSGVTASGYGDAATVAKVVVDSNGHVTSVVNTAIAISAAAITSGTLAVVRGGTAQTAINGNGSLLIGNTVSGGFDVNPITQGTNITVTNDKGSITISSSDAFAQAQANAAYARANAAYANANTAIYTAAQIRANLSNTAPINYDPTTGVISHALSGVTASGYGDAATVAKVVVDSNGHVTSVVNTAIAIDAAAITSGTLAVVRGGTAQTAINGNGSLLIGNTVSGGYDVNTLTQGTGIAITNDKGSITIAATGGSSIDQYARDKANGAAQNSFITINVAGQSDIVADSNVDTLILVGSGITLTTDAGTDTLTIQHPASGVVASGYGDAATVPKVVVDANGHLTSVTNTAIAISASQITSGTLSVARGGTGQTAITVNGSLLIGNTVSGGFDVNPITQGTNITVTNDKGSITISSSDAFAQAQANAAFNQANLAYANANTAIYTAAQIRANISNTAPIRYDATTGIVSHADSGVTATGYGDAATIPVFVANATGHLTSVTNTAIAISATQITSGTLSVARGGTAQTAINGNGSLLIGNTVSGGYDVNTLTQGTGILITNDKGSITIESSVGKTYYYENGTLSDVGVYHKLLTVPSTLTENTISHAATGTLSFTLLSSFITAIGEPNVTLLPAGTYGRHIYGTTLASNQVARLRIEVYKYASNTLETLIQTADSPDFWLGNENPLLTWNLTNTTGYPLDPTDRILVKWYGSRVSGPGTCNIELYTQGNNRASYTTTTILGDSGTTVTSVAGRTGAVVLNTNDVTENTAGPFYHTAARVRGNVSNTAPINYEPSTGVFSHADSGAAASGYGDAATVPKVVVDAKGHVTSVTNTAIAISAAAITSGTLAVVRGGTGQTAITVNGSLLIGNTVSGGFDVNPITPGTNMTVTNDKGSITLSSSDAFAQAQANAAFNQANLAYANANTAIYTAAQIRANISNTAPIRYDATTGIVSHADSGVTPSGYGDAATIPVFVANATGHISSVVNTAIAISATQITSGTLAVVRGGTAQTAINGNGSLLIGNTVSGGYDVNTLTQGTGIAITNDKGAITIAATGGSAIDQYARDKANGAAQNAFVTLVVSGQSDVVADSNTDTLTIANTTPINITTDAGTDTITFTHATSGVVATGHGDAATVPKFIVDDKGHVTSVTNTAIAISASQITSGTLAVARGGTGQTAITVNGSLLIGNTVSGGFDVNPITQGTNITVTNDKGSITIASSDAFAQAQANAAFNQANLAYANANTAIYTAAQIRANISNTAPIRYDATTGIVSHADSGVVATGYGDANTIPVFVANATGHLTSVTNTAITFSDGSATSPSILHRGDPDTGFWFPAADTIAASTNGLERVRITDAGWVGVGTTVPNTQIELVANDVFAFISIMNYSGDPGTSPDPEFSTQAARGTPFAPAAVQKDDTLVVLGAAGHNGSAFTFNKVYNEMFAAEDWTSANNGTGMRFNTTANNSIATRMRMLIDGNGYIGIANSSPKHNVSISGNVFIRETLTLRSGIQDATGSTGSANGVLTSNGTAVLWKSASANGQLLIGNTATGGFDVNTLTQGTGISITNTQGAIEIAATGGSAIDQYARDKANGAAQNAFVTLVVSGQSDVVADSNTDTLTIVNTAPINITTDAGTDTVTWSHATSGVTATGYGDAATIPVLVVNATGHLTGVTNTAIAISASQVTSGTLAVARGGTGQTAITVNGSLLIGNTVSGGFDVNPITQGTNITVTNDKGSITISSSDAFAQAQANAAFNQANLAYANANTAIYTAAQIRANISNTAPIRYDATTGIVSHADSGVTPSGYGDAATIPVFVANATGHISSVTNTAIAISAAQITSGTLAVARGGTGQTAITVNGSLLIGNTVSGGFDVNPITQGTNITITNDKGSITIASSDAFAQAQANAAFNQANLAYANANTAIYTAAQIRANISNTAPIRYDATTGIISHADSGVVATGYGDAATIPVFVANATGHISSVTNTAIAISAAQITSGTLAVARGGTGQTAITVNGSLLIGNTVSGGFDVNPITQGTNITVTNDKGSITISSSDAFAQAQANAAFNQANLAYANANTAIYTAAQIRANISNTAPIRYDATTGIVSHADSGVVASGYGDAATIPVFVANVTGHISSVVNTAIAIAASQITSGTLAVVRGGTAQTAINGNGSLLIGNTVSGGYDVNTLTQGTGIAITNDKGSITIAATGGSAIDQYARDKANGAVQTGFVTLVVAGQSDVVADSNVDTLTLVAGTNMTITTDAGTDTITFAASGGGGNGFGIANVAAYNVGAYRDVVADTSSDTITLVGGKGILLTTNANNDVLTINATSDLSVTINVANIAVNTWTTRLTNDNQWRDIAWSPELGLFAAVSNTGSVNRVATSFDGITWTNRTTNDNDWHGIAWSPKLGLFAAVSQTGSVNRVMTSPDGITWTTRTTNDNNWTDITWSPELGLFVAVSVTGSVNRAMTSSDGTTWTPQTTNDNQWNGITWSSELGLFVAVAISGTSDRVMTSPNGTTWNTRTTNNNDWRSVAWSPKLGLFVAVSDTGTADRAMTSPNGVDWTTRTTNDNDWQRIAWAPELGLFAAVSDTGSSDRMMTSPDGIVWTTRPTNSNPWFCIAWSPELGIFAALSTTGPDSAMTSQRMGLWRAVANLSQPVSGIFYENSQNVTGNYAITTGKSAMSTGPITLNPSVVVTVPGGSRWVVI